MIVRRCSEVLSPFGQALFQRTGILRAVSSHKFSAEQKSSKSTDPREVEKFAALASEWWSPSGPFRALHELNNARVHFIKDVSRHALKHKTPITTPLQGLNILDVGCGGGILAEALARLGGHVTGIDVMTENIKVATEHMSRDPSLPADLRCLLLHR